MNTYTLLSLNFTYLMGNWTFCIFPVEADVDECDEEERAPEDNVGEGDDDEHLHVLDPLLLELDHVRLQLEELTGRHMNQLLKIDSALKCFGFNDVKNMSNFRN